MGPTQQPSPCYIQTQLNTILLINIINKQTDRQTDRQRQRERDDRERERRQTETETETDRDSQTKH